VQTHLLARAFMLCAAQRRDDAVASELGRRQWIGAAAIGALRIKQAMAIEGDGIDAVAKLFQLHPHFHPRSYIDLRIELSGDATARISLGDCPALQEADPYSWLATLGPDAHPALTAIASVVNPPARCRAVANARGERHAWEIVIDPAAEPLEEPAELRLGRVSRGVEFQLTQRRTLRQ
jgi:hypothetical protein